MNIIIPLAVSVVLLLLFGQSEKLWVVKMLSGVSAIVFGVISLLAVCQFDKVFDIIPGTSIEEVEFVEIEPKGSFYLDSSQSAVLTNEFFMPADSKEELEDWLDKTNKDVTVHIRSGSKLVYSKSLGLHYGGMADDVLEMYDRWKTEGLMPVGKVRYSFFVFYLDV